MVFHPIEAIDARIMFISTTCVIALGGCFWKSRIHVRILKNPQSHTVRRAEEIAEETLDFVLGVLRGVGAVDDVIGRAGGRVTADGAGDTIFEFGGAHLNGGQNTMVP